MTDADAPTLPQENSLWYFMPLTERLRQRGIDSILATHADLSGPMPGIHFVIKSGENYQYLNLSPSQLWQAGSPEDIVRILLDPKTPAGCDDTELPELLTIKWASTQDTLTTSLSVKATYRADDGLCHLTITVSSDEGRSGNGLAQLEPLRTYHQLTNYVFGITSPRFWLHAVRVETLQRPNVDALADW